MVVCDRAIACIAGVFFLLPKKGIKQANYRANDPWARKKMEISHLLPSPCPFVFFAFVITVSFSSGSGSEGEFLAPFPHGSHEKKMKAKS